MKLPWGATVATACGAAILIGLGSWQIHRLQWKQDIFEKLGSGYEMAQQQRLTDAAQLQTLSQQEYPIAYGMVKGQLMRDKAILLGGRIHDGKPGYHLLIPMRTEDGRPLMVNTGWVDILWSDDTEDRLSTLPSSGEDIIVSGVLRKSDWSFFSSKNSPANDVWFRPDIGQIAQEKEIENPYPFVLYADTTTPPLQGVVAEERWQPRNKHLQYALFWYMMGICLIGVYGFYVASLNKKKAL